MDQIQALIQSGQLQSHHFPVTSRYHHIKTTKIDGFDGQPIVYLKRRFIQPPENYTITKQHIVQQGERLDNITAQYLVDPEQFWQLADANLAMKPQELTEAPGKSLKIPQGTVISGI